MKNKVKVLRVTNDPNLAMPAFQVYLNDNLARVFHFKEDVSKDNIYDEELNKKAAIEYAEKIEKMGVGPLEEVIYETPEE